MTTTIIAGVIFITGLCIGIVIFLYLGYSKQRNNKASTCQADTAGLTFEWKYVSLPLTILFMSFVVIAIFFFQLPDQVAYRFNSDGSPENWIGRLNISAVMLGVQALIAVAIILVVRSVVNFGKTITKADTGLNLDRFMLLIGNIAALPQLVLAVVMFDIFSFNLVGEHVLSIWFIILTMAIVGVVILAVFFIKAFMHTTIKNK
ncbi:MAG: hypothetical protein WC958_05165 [Dehalococcoidales bacterium]